MVCQAPTVARGVRHTFEPRSVLATMTEPAPQLEAGGRNQVGD
jgi:hypothetical protein